ncbi:MAG: hypothetical protein WA962_14150 [Ornithinimicrobium sp.]
MVVPGVSYAQALTYPGNASWQERSVEWVRDHGGAGVVNAVENWYYTRNKPPTVGPDPTTLPPQNMKTGDTVTATTPTAIPALAGATPLPGEGTWSVKRTSSDGSPVLYSTILRPDPNYAGVVAAAAHIPAGTTTAHLVAGTRQPGGTGWGGNAAIPVDDQSSIVATFNSGWKYKDFDGGFYANKHANPPLKDGMASAVIDTSGQISVGQWGKDVTMTPDVVAVRQNLHMVIENGTPVPGLDSNAAGRWGSARNQLQYTWRSGLGTDKAGDLIYVAGDNLTLKSLATAMDEAGIQQGMELDIHPKMVNFATWSPSSSGQLSPTNLLPGMSASAHRYVAADQRDFFYLTLP